MNIDHLISGIIGLLTGALASLFAPWVNWRLEKKKSERLEKQKLIENLRQYALKNSIKDDDFINSVDYIRIRPYLSELFVTDLENQNETIVLMGASRSKYQSDLLDEIDRIEVDWKLKISNKNYTTRKHESNSGKIKVTFMKSL